MTDAVAADARPCSACGAPMAGPFCAQCGQRVMRGRHTLRSMLGSALGRVLNLEGGLLATAGQLTVAPHRVIRDFIDGRTGPYTHPMGYLLVTFAIFALVGGLLDLTVQGAGSDNRVYTALAVPFIALAARVVFLRGRLNYAEHLIATMYLFGHVALLLAGLQLVVPLLGQRAIEALLIGALIGAAAYFVWPYTRLFPRRPVLSALGALLALCTGVLLWALALIVFVRLAQSA